MNPNDAIEALRKRLSEVGAQQAPVNEGEIYDLPQKVCSRVNATLRDIFGAGSHEYNDWAADTSSFFVSYGDPNDHFRKFPRAIKIIQENLQNAIDLITERSSRVSSDEKQRSLRAYEGLDLHPEIARASGELYLGGHYANAIEDAVKALNALVRLRSDVEADGDGLMTTVFSPSKPILKFNDVKDKSDQDEQKGFMMMFQGAVAGLRNPRAHKLIKDDPERALEFIAFVSLLAKLLDGATKAHRP